MSVKKFELLRNRTLNNQALYQVFLFFVLLLTGCAGNVPPTIALTKAQEQDASALLQRIRERRCSNFLDTDVTIHWQGYGQSRKVSATLQATRQGGLRLSLLDPLFRPFLILAANGTTFTLVDNRQGKGYTGFVDSTFLRQYIPADLQLSTCFSFLAAQLPRKEMFSFRFARSGVGSTYWYIFAGKNGLQQHAEIDPDSGLLFRQLLVDAGGSIILDVRYDYKGCQPLQNDCLYPAHLSIEGQNISGTVQITLDKRYNASLADEIFHLQIPDHFIVTEVE